jgi:NAD(P)-dependent dehydrogenase (short-subunit alcohol dehydrogenase family)
MDRDLSGVVAIVTGGGRGIGAAISKRLAAARANVVVADICESNATRTADDIGPTATGMVVDVSSPSDAERLVADTVAKHDRIDILVNNAGIIAVEPLDRTNIDTWRQIFAVNVEGPLSLMLAASAVMLNQQPSERTGCRGKFISISSEAAEHGRLVVPAYGASKAALNHLSRSAAVTWGDEGICTTIVYPGDVEGAMWPRVGEQIAAAQGLSTEEVIRERLESAPSGQFQLPEEVADAVLFVAAFRGLDLNGRTVWTHPHVSGS